MMDFFTQFNTADFVILGVITLSVLISLLRGFVREALSLTTWLIAAYLAFTFSSSVGEKLSGMISSAPTRTIVAFIAILVGVMILGAILNFFIARIITLSGLGIFDRFLGIFFGAARGFLLLALVILMIQGTSLTERKWWQGSQLIPLFQPLTAEMAGLFPKQTEQASGLIKNDD